MIWLIVQIGSDLATISLPPSLPRTFCTGSNPTPSSLASTDLPFPVLADVDTRTRTSIGPAETIESTVTRCFDYILIITVIGKRRAHETNFLCPTAGLGPFDSMGKGEMEAISRVATE